MAEGGNVAPLTALLNSDTNVMDVQNSDGLHGPGNTGGVHVTGSDTFNRLSLATMLIPTNDAFVGLNTTLPADGETKVVYAYAYDAGTEVNDERCASIPGPDYPECGGPGTGGAPWRRRRSGPDPQRHPRRWRLRTESRLEEPSSAHHDSKDLLVDRTR